MDRLGTPKDFWPVAVIALATTVSVAGLSTYQIKEDTLHGNVNVSDCSGHTNGTSFTPTFPGPTVSGEDSLKSEHTPGVQHATYFRAMPSFSLRI